jgi:hypothetical protein
MIGLNVEVDAGMPTDAVYLQLAGPGLRVVVAPTVEAKVLAALQPELAVAVAGAVAKLEDPTHDQERGDQPT